MTHRCAAVTTHGELVIIHVRAATAILATLRWIFAVVILVARPRENQRCPWK